MPDDNTSLKGLVLTAAAAWAVVLGLWWVSPTLTLIAGLAATGWLVWELWRAPLIEG